jgi:4-hydroxyphenylpyruvate dioxygenase-like putative hemolysin
MIDHLKMCFENAQLDKSKCSVEILKLDGMSGRRTRHFYNNLLTLPDARYLEIGTWKGSSVCSAMFENNANVVCVDNWTEFSGPKNEFLINFNKFKGINTAKFIEQDCFSIDVNTLPKFNIYLYDGDHKEESHYKALTHYIHCMDDSFIYVVDDWNWKSVRDGTQKAIKDLNLKILYEIDHRTTNNDTHPVFRSAQQVLWHNGIYAAVLLKH